MNYTYINNAMIVLGLFGLYVWFFFTFFFDNW